MLFSQVITYYNLDRGLTKTYILRFLFGVRTRACLGFTASKVGLGVL